MPKEKKLFHVKLSALMLFLSAFGILVFWTHWFFQQAYLNTQSNCFRVYENTFLFPDAALVGCLCLAAVLLLRHRELALLFGWFAAGMSAYKIALDCCFHYQQASFALPHSLDAIEKLLTLLFFVLLLIFLVWRFSRAKAYLPRSEQPAPIGIHFVCCGILLLYLVMVSLSWLVFFWGPSIDQSPCAEAFHNAFQFPDILTIATGALAVLGYTVNRFWAVPFGLITAGGVLFGALNYTAFGLFNPKLIEAQEYLYYIIIPISLLTVFLITHWVWQSRNALK